MAPEQTGRLRFSLRSGRRCGAADGALHGARSDRPQGRGPRPLRARESRWTPASSGHRCPRGQALRAGPSLVESGRPSSAWSRHCRIVRRGAARPCRAGAVDRRPRLRSGMVELLIRPFSGPARRCTACGVMEVMALLGDLHRLREVIGVVAARQLDDARAARPRERRRMVPRAWASRRAVTAAWARCRAGSGLQPTSCSAGRVAGRAHPRRRGQAAGASTSTRAGAARVAARWRTLWTVRPLASAVCSPRFRLTPIL